MQGGADINASPLPATLLLCFSTQNSIYRISFRSEEGGIAYKYSATFYSDAISFKFAFIVVTCIGLIGSAGYLIAGIFLTRM